MMILLPPQSYFYVVTGNAADYLIYINSTTLFAFEYNYMMILLSPQSYFYMVTGNAADDLIYINSTTLFAFEYN